MQVTGLRFAASWPRLQRLSVRQLTDRPARSTMSDTAIALWVDTDAGVDDAQGLLLAAASPRVRMVGISAVWGNTAVDNVCRNVLRVLTAAGQATIPVYVGAPEPLLCAPYKSTGVPWDGYDGLGDAPQVWPTADDVKACVSPGHAAVKLIEAADQYKGNLQVLALGPLTNLALAVKLDPGLPGRISKLVIMGGARGPGNMSPHAEFNFFCDPEAAHIVINKFANIVVVPCEAGASHPLPWAEFDSILAKPTRTAKFFAGISAKHIASARRKDGPGFVTNDPGAVAVAIAPEIVQASERVYCDVELQGRHTRGMSVFDWEQHLGRPPNVEVVSALDMRMFMQLLDHATD